MKRSDALKVKIEGYLIDKDIYEDKNFSSLVSYYVNKARHNLLTAKMMYNISENTQSKRALSVPEDYTAFDWVIVAGYYAMFYMATALLGLLSIRTRSHESLISALEYQFVYEQDLIQKDFIKKMSEAKKLEERYINRMWAAKSIRTLAHYKAEKEISRIDANKILGYADRFVERLHEIILEIKKR